VFDSSLIFEVSVQPVYFVLKRNTQTTKSITTHDSHANWMTHVKDFGIGGYSVANISDGTLSFRTMSPIIVRAATYRCQNI
jgi:hypothetical protein